MRMTNVAQMSLPPGRVRSYGVEAADGLGRALPVSFDQGRHVDQGQRAGSWMAVAFRPVRPVDDDDLAAAWRAVIARHGTLRTAFTRGPDGTVRLHEIDLRPGRWFEHDVAAGQDPREVVRALLDEACAPFARPSHRMCVVQPDDGRPTVVLGLDHAHVDAWSLLVLVRDLTRCLDDLATGRPPGGDLPPADAFARHTAVLEAMPPAPEVVQRRWREILRASGEAMPTFPLPLGDLSAPHPEVVEVRDVLDAAELTRFEAQARGLGVRPFALAVSVMTRAIGELASVPLRAVLPVHSRHAERWHDSVGWFITNALLECSEPDPAACAAAVAEAISLGSHPLAPILAPYGGMPTRPGMFAVSWLDTRRLPVAVDDRLEPQHVSAVIRTDGVMIWFVVNTTGLHLRCRYPDTTTARSSVGAWLDDVEVGLRASLR